MYLLLFLFLLARRSQQVLCLGLERVLKPLSNGCLGIIIKINLTTNYQLLLNCNKVHRADTEHKCTTGDSMLHKSPNGTIPAGGAVSLVTMMQQAGHRMTLDNKDSSLDINQS
jgi:hypothetical protein